MAWNNKSQDWLISHQINNIFTKNKIFKITVPDQATIPIGLSYLIWWVFFVGINFMKDGINNFLLLFLNVFSSMHHLTSHHSLFSHLQFTPNVLEVNLVIRLSSHLGITIKGNGPFIIEVLQCGTDFHQIFAVNSLPWVWTCLNAVFNVILLSCSQHALLIDCYSL